MAAVCTCSRPTATSTVASVKPCRPRWTSRTRYASTSKYFLRRPPRARRSSSKLASAPSYRKPRFSHSPSRSSIRRASASPPARSPGAPRRSQGVGVAALVSHGLLGPVPHRLGVDVWRAGALRGREGISAHVGLVPRRLAVGELRDEVGKGREPLQLPRAQRLVAHLELERRRDGDEIGS